MSIAKLDGVNPPRLCRIRKREDFQGYGFNLQAEKGKPGQFIGNVDAGSPAELSGVKKNDRVIEVNGVNVCNEAHKQVVARIKEIPDEVTLLVMDHESERKYLENGIIIRSQMDIVEKHGMENSSPDVPISNGDSVLHETSAAAATEDEEEVKANVIEVEEPENAEEVVEEPEAVTETVEQLEISEAAEEPVMEDAPEDANQEDEVEVSNEQESGSYDIAATSERLYAEEATDEVPGETKEVTADETEETQEVTLNGTRESTPEITEFVPETETTNQTPSTASMNGDTKPESKSDLIFSYSAAQARANQSRSRRRAIKETKQTFKEKYMLFENL